MNEPDLRRVVLDAIPPLAAPADRMQSLGRRVRRQRMRFMATAGAASVTLLAAAAGFVTVLGGESAATTGNQTAAAPAATLASPTATPSASSSPKSTKDGRPTESPEAAKARLNEAAKAALRKAVPGLTITKSTPMTHEEASDFFEYNVAYLVKGHGRTGTVEITVRMPVEGFTLTCAANNEGGGEESAGINCKDRKGPHGELIVSFPTLGDGPSTGGGGKRFRGTGATVTRADGVIVEVLCINATEVGTSSPSHTAASQPLTAQDAIDVALDAGLTLYP